MNEDIAAVLRGEREWCVITGDCLEILPTLPEGCVGALVTDPPFGIGFGYNTYEDSSDGYGEWLWSILEQSERLAEPGSPFFVWQAMPNCRHFSEWFPRNYRLFAACKNFVQMRPQAMNHAWDPVLVWWTEGKPWRDLEKKIVNRDFYVADTASAVANTKAIEKQHPCPRPLGHLLYIVSQWVRPQAIVLDPFCGSATTGVACLKTGRRFIGIELDSHYAEIARRRLETTEKDQRDSLFPAREAGPQQRTFADVLDAEEDPSC